MDASKHFIENTAKDYGMSVGDVWRVSKLSRDSCEFYEKLESFISHRAQESAGTTGSTENTGES